MLRSMTGFGAASGRIEGAEYAVEIRSVNNRYLKIALRLPEPLQSLETKIEQTLRARLQRGSVTVVVRMKLPDDQAGYRVNATALSNYLDQLRPLEVEANPMLRVDLGSLLQLPGVCTPPPPEELVEMTAEGLLALIEEALEALMKMRLQEGLAVFEDLRANTRIIETKLTVISDRTDEVLQLYHKRLGERVGELVARAQIKIDEETLAREVAIFAERSDIAEELSRLKMYLGEFLKACEESEAIGRKLDFVAQEMLREANTIASKASDADVGLLVVDIKTAIDRIKEQAANVE